ncbi:aldo/keto reductase [Ornithinimicrobium sp. INDO-MA30-4]|uniref:aldo/keto reductase n=1 Tax=Ornithinimicrobium sp. INDO-MA30-4 TaxID=2908651 RepID=UPI001F2CFAD5|nr:aldo/keto reductase [Ornithinimicrobium sp. INDO-MA30-4]UJH69680.1 aldo/keto reductase [Ornithinimicrobium sp. INDO-MA30-4]
MTIPNIVLNNGVEIPQVGLGVFQIPDDETQVAVESALEAGYRHIDTAAGYQNEAGVGAALKASGLPESDVFVTTKLRNGEQGFEKTLQAFENSRRELGVDVIDLYLIHWPVPAWGKAADTWKAMEKLYAEGAVRAIGISNFLPDHVEDLMKGVEVTPAVNQFELHPSFQQPGTQAASTKHGIAVEAYAPIGQAKDLSLPAIKEIAAAHGVSEGQVVLRWHLQNGTIIIPKSVTPERIRSNIDLFGFELSADQMATITGLDTDERMFPDPQTADFTMM